MLKFRYATAEDYENFNEFYKYRDFLGAGQLAKADSMSRKDFDEYIGYGNIILAESDSNTIVGYAQITAYDDGIVSLRDIQLAPMKMDYIYDFVKYIEAESRNIGMKKVEVISDTLETDFMWKRMGYNSVNNSDLYAKNI